MNRTFDKNTTNGFTIGMYNAIETVHVNLSVWNAIWNMNVC